jgi:hypothetical protein
MNNRRPAKSGSDFSQLEMDAYNIVFEQQTFVQFFGMQPPRLPSTPFIEFENAGPEMSDSTYHLFRSLDLAMDGANTHASRAPFVSYSATCEI